jgi:hypothetical protein
LADPLQSHPPQLQPHLQLDTTPAPRSAVTPRDGFSS